MRIFSVFICLTFFVRLGFASSFLTECQQTIWKQYSLVPLEETVTAIGYVGPSLEETPETLKTLAKVGVFPWSYIVVLVTSKEQMDKIDSVNDKAIFRPSYLIVSSDLLEKIRYGLKNKKDVVSVQEFFDEIQNSEHFWLEEGVPRKAPSRYLRNVIALDKASFFLSESYKDKTGKPERQAMQALFKEMKIAYLNPGHMLSSPHRRGIIDFNDWMESRAMKKNRERLRSLQRKGYSVTFNERQEESLEMLGTQEREKGNMDVSINLFAHEEVTSYYRDRFKDGSAVTSEFIAPDNRLLGGVIGYVVDGLISAESVFYEGNFGIDYARYAVMALGAVAKENGIHWMDIQEVSNFSKMLKGKYISREDFYLSWKELPQINKLTFPNDWKQD